MQQGASVAGADGAAEEPEPDGTVQRGEGGGMKVLVEIPEGLTAEADLAGLKDVVQKWAARMIRRAKCGYKVKARVERAPEDGVKVCAVTRLSGIGAAARALGINRSHFQNCVAGKRKAGPKTLAAMRQLGLVPNEAKNAAE